MKTEKTEENGGRRGELFYDAECSLCMHGVALVGELFARRGFRWVPMQTSGTAARLGISDANLQTEMKLRLPDGRVVGGIDCWACLLRSVWWLWPIGVLLSLPGLNHIAAAGYGWLARHRYCFGSRCAVRRHGRGDGVWRLLLLLLLPLCAGLLTWHLPAWVLMGALAAAVWLAAKWITGLHAVRGGIRPATSRWLAWFAAWPGLDAWAFLAPAGKQKRPPMAGWIWAGAKVIGGAWLVFHAAALLLPGQPLVAGWIGMVGLILMFHFGIVDLLAFFWQSRGVAAHPLMVAPFRSTSLSDLWGRRWNTGFSIPARRLIFLPAARRYGPRVATALVFLLSGLLHELVITVPARGGFGLPTAYFLFQALGLFLQGTAVAKRLELDRGWRGWLWTTAFAVGPVCGLFPPIFVDRVIVPMLQFLHALIP